MFCCWRLKALPTCHFLMRAWFFWRRAWIFLSSSMSLCSLLGCMSLGLWVEGDSAVVMRTAETEPD